MLDGAMKDAIDRAFARRRRARLERLLAVAQRDVEQLTPDDFPERRAELERDVGILQEELERVRTVPPPALDELDDDEDEYVELEAEIREHEESLHIADNAATYVARALEGNTDAAAEVHRAQRWLDRLRWELATSTVPPDPQLAGRDLAGVDIAFASRGAPALERPRETIDRARRNLKAARLGLRKQADLLHRRITARRAED